jgi:hypothetical protein
MDAGLLTHDEIDQLEDEAALLWWDICTLQAVLDEHTCDYVHRREFLDTIHGRNQI